MGQQPGSCRGGDYDDDDEILVLLVEETGVAGGNHRPPASYTLTYVWLWNIRIRHILD